jgi:alpha-glucosidase (family GH31 glycosyl hydrolase)
VGSYTSLTGRQPLPPRWAFGNFASRFGYHTEQEARAVVKKFADQKIPLDAIVFDLYWFGKDIKGTMGNLAFDKDNFPTPKKMVSDFAAQGVKTVLITEPFVLTSSSKWQDAVDSKALATDAAGAPARYDFYFGNTGLIDIYSKTGKDWFWNIYKGLRQDYGVAGWWGDLGEPEVHPSTVRHGTGTADQVHNTYGHDWARLIAERAPLHPDARRLFRFAALRPDSLVGRREPQLGRIEGAAGDRAADGHAGPGLYALGPGRLRQPLPGR